MKKIFKNSIVRRLLLAVVLCLPFEVHSSEDASLGDLPTCIVTSGNDLSSEPFSGNDLFTEDLSLDNLPTFLMASDKNYLGPTAVVIQSLKETNPYEKKVIILSMGIRAEDQDKLRNMADDLTVIVIVDLLDERFQHLTGFDDQEIDLLDSIKEINSGQWGDLRFKNEQKENEQYRRMINLRLFFPEIFRELFREMPIKNFLWLDSDLIVLQDLSNLFEECRSRPEQSIIGADLDYSSHVCEEDELQNISSDSDECISSGFNFRYIQGETTINTGQKYYSKEDIKNALQNISRGQDILREKLGDYMPSGGVVFWSIQKIIEECTEQRVNVFQKAMKPQGDNGSNQDDNDNNTQIAYATEEYVFQLYLANSTLDDIYFFPIIYNITVDSCGVFFEFKKNHRYLQKKMFIFHWDSIEKPWGSEKLRGLGEEEDATDSFLDKQNEKWWEFAVKTEFYTEEKKVKQDQFELASV